eukprot:COSAG01_NODE_47123_length_393_cov_1.200680_1_plen_78_part_10
MLHVNAANNFHPPVSLLLRKRAARVSFVREHSFSCELSSSSQPTASVKVASAGNKSPLRETTTVYLCSLGDGCQLNSL